MKGEKIKADEIMAMERFNKDGNRFCSKGNRIPQMTKPARKKPFERKVDARAKKSVARNHCRCVQQSIPVVFELARKETILHLLLVLTTVGKISEKRLCIRSKVQRHWTEWK